MLTQDDLKAIGKLVTETVKPLLKPIKEDLEVTKSKVSKMEMTVQLSGYQITDLVEKVSVVNEKVDTLTENQAEMDKKLDYLTGQADTTYGLLEETEASYEKRLKRVEKTLNLPPIEP